MLDLTLVKVTEIKALVVDGVPGVRIHFDGTGDDSHLSWDFVINAVQASEMSSILVKAEAMAKAAAELEAFKKLHPLPGTITLPPQLLLEKPNGEPE